MEPACFSIPEPVHAPHTTLGSRAGRWAWARALPGHTALAAGGVVALVTACLSLDGTLALAAAVAIGIAARVRRAVAQVGTDAPLVAAIVGPRRARVLSLRRSVGGWMPTVLDARVLSRRGLGGEVRAVGYLLRYRGGYGFVPLTALVSSRARALARPSARHARHFILLERLATDPRLSILGSDDLDAPSGRHVASAGAA